MRRRAVLVPMAVASTVAACASTSSAGGGGRIVPACALGRLPSSLRTALPDGLARERRRFDRSLRGVGGAARSRAEQVFSSGVAAYLYGMPTVLVRLTVAGFPVNLPLGVGQLATPGTHAVVAPNHDTLYTVSRLDLTAGPVMIDAPDTHGRYSVLQLLDAFSNVAGYVGAGRERTHAATVALVAPGFTGALPPGVRTLHSPTKLVWLLGRTLVDGPRDLPSARAVMLDYSVTPLADPELCPPTKWPRYQVNPWSYP